MSNIAFMRRLDAQSPQITTSSTLAERVFSANNNRKTSIRASQQKCNFNGCEESQTANTMPISIKSQVTIPTNQKYNQTNTSSSSNTFKKKSTVGDFQPVQAANGRSQQKMENSGQLTQSSLASEVAKLIKRRRTMVNKQQEILRSFQDLKPVLSTKGCTVRLLQQLASSSSNRAGLTGTLKKAKSTKARLSKKKETPKMQHESQQDDFSSYCRPLTPNQQLVSQDESMKRQDYQDGVELVADNQLSNETTKGQIQVEYLDELETILDEEERLQNSQTAALLPTLKQEDPNHFIDNNEQKSTQNSLKDIVSDMHDLSQLDDDESLLISPPNDSYWYQLNELEEGLSISINDDINNCDQDLSQGKMLELSFNFKFNQEGLSVGGEGGEDSMELMEDQTDFCEEEMFLQMYLSPTMQSFDTSQCA